MTSRQEDTEGAPNLQPLADTPTPKADKDRFVSSPRATDGRSEVSIAVNPANRSEVICASNRNPPNSAQAQYYCTDGGGFWHATGLPIQAGDRGHTDPSLAWTSNGVAWASTIASTGAPVFSQLRVYRSTDNGATWTFDATPPQASPAWTDRATLCSDTLSDHRKDYLYVTYTHGVTHHDVFVSWRPGSSASTAWQTTAASLSGAETTGAATGGDIAINLAGDVFVFWPDTGSSKIFVAKSSADWSSGVATTLTFGAPVMIATTFATDSVSIPAASQRPPSIYVSGAAYKSADRDMAYAVWMDLSGMSGCTTNGNAPGSNTDSTCQTRIWFSKSSDGGSTWSTAKKVNHWVPSYDEFHPRLVVDDTNGHLVLSFYASGPDAHRTVANVFCLFSADEGETWSNRVCVTSQPSDETAPNNLNQYGDYAGLSGRAGVFLPAWTDRRKGAAGNSQIWTAPVYDPYRWSNLSRPAAGIRCEQGVGAFVFGENEAAYACVLGSDKQIWVCSFDGNPLRWRWRALSSPAGATLTGVVGALGTQSSDFAPPDEAYVFFTCNDNKLYAYKYDGSSWTLLSCGQPPTSGVGVNAGAAFGAIALLPADETGQVPYALVPGSDSQPWAVHLNSSDQTWKWEACGKGPTITYAVRGLVFQTQTGGAQYPAFFYAGPKRQNSSATVNICWYDGAKWNNVTIQDQNGNLKIHDLLAAIALPVSTGASWPEAFYTTYPNHYPAYCLYNGVTASQTVITQNPITYGLGALLLNSPDDSTTGVALYYWDSSGELRRQITKAGGAWVESFYGTPSANVQVVGNVGVVSTGKSAVQRSGIHSFVIGSDGNLWQHRSSWSD